MLLRLLCNYFKLVNILFRSTLTHMVFCRHIQLLVRIGITYGPIPFFSPSLPSVCKKHPTDANTSVNVFFKFFLFSGFLKITLKIFFLDIKAEELNIQLVPFFIAFLFYIRRCRTVNLTPFA